MPMLNDAHALVIGIANYNAVISLPKSVLEDARAIHAALIDPYLGGYLSANVTLLLDQAATRAGILQALDALAHIGTDATVFIYVSSHGGQILSGPYAGEYLLPADTRMTSADTLASSAISSVVFTEALRAIPARKVVVIFDCCHAGGIGLLKDASMPELKVGLPESYYERLSAGRGRVILASSRDTEFSYLLPGATHSLFTQHLLDGLRGGAPNADGMIRIFDLFHYVQPRVIAAHPAQHPVFKAEIEENFPIALYLGGKTAAPAPTSADEFDYDVFISYAASEGGWMRDELLPKLEAHKLRCCVDYRDFRAGATRLDEVERAVLTSRKTLLILSPAYLQSEWNEAGNKMVQSLDPASRRKRMIPLLKAPCELPLRISYLVPLDFANPVDEAIEWKKLFTAITS